MCLMQAKMGLAFTNGAPALNFITGNVRFVEIRYFFNTKPL